MEQLTLDSRSPLMGKTVRICFLHEFCFLLTSSDCLADYNGLYQALTSLNSKRSVSKGSVTPFYTPYSKGGLIGFFTGGSTSNVSANLQAVVSDLKSIAGAQVDLKPILKQVCSS
jgi:hypothetical protein